MRLALCVLAVAACGDKQPELRCERPVGGLDAHLEKGKLVWFGEVHGTEESPRFVGDVACLAAKRAGVQVGLEIWASEQARFDAYVRSDGGEAARAELLAGPFWGQVDGRASHAMVALVERVRVLRRAGAKIDFVLFDGSGERDETMAKNVIRARDPKRIFVALTGNVHSRNKKGTSWDPELMPTVAHLVAAKLPVVTFDVSASGGTTWACMSTKDAPEPVCGVHPMPDHEGGGEPWTLGPTRNDAHDGVYFVGTTKASPPARSK